VECTRQAVNFSLQFLKNTANLTLVLTSHQFFGTKVDSLRGSRLEVFRIRARFHLTQINIISFMKGGQLLDNSENDYYSGPPPYKTKRQAWSCYS